MNDNEKVLTSESGTVESGAETDYIAAIKELRDNSVAKEQYAKLQAENSRLLSMVTKGETITPEPKETVDELRAALYNRDGQLSNIQFIEKTLKLRNRLMEAGYEDPFLPVGTQVAVTQQMRDKAQNVADGLQYCLDFAEGDSGIFTATYQRITKDPAGVRRAR